MEIQTFSQNRKEIPRTQILNVIVCFTSIVPPMIRIRKVMYFLIKTGTSKIVPDLHGVEKAIGITWIHDTYLNHSSLEPFLAGVFLEQTPNTIVSVHVRRGCCVDKLLQHQEVFLSFQVLQTKREGSALNLDIGQVKVTIQYSNNPHKLRTSLQQTSTS